MKKYTHINFYILLFIITGIIGSCKNKNFSDHIGPTICASDNFQYLQQFTISNASVDLSAAPQNFSAKFSEDVPWTLVITGQTSHSYKKFSGYGSILNLNWLGNPDTLVFFVAEQCKVVFQVACKDPITQYFNITTTSTFKTLNYLVYDGDGNDGYDNTTLTGGYGTFATHTTTSGLNSPQGGKCFCTHGQTVPADSMVWYFGGYDLPITFGTSVSTDPTKVYFNCFVNVKGSTKTCPTVQFAEGSAKRSKNLLVFGTGWHYVTFPLSDLGVVNPRNITMVSFTLNSYPTQYNTGDMCIDFLTFTNDAPFVTTSAANK